MANLDGETIKFAGALIVFGSGLIYDGFRKFRLKQQIEDMPTSPIATAAQGLVEFQGTAHAISSEVSMASHWTRPVACSRVQLQYYTSGKNSRWVTAYEGVLVDRFIVTDKSGSSWVLVKDAELEIEGEIINLNQLDPAARLKLMNLIPRLNRKTLFSRFTSLETGTWRLIDQTIEIGQDVYVLGYFKSRSIEKSVKVHINHQGGMVEVTPRGGVMNYSPHKLIVSNEKQSKLLDRMKTGFLRMIFGAVLISAAVLVFLKF